METAILLLILACLAAGVTGTLFTAWNVRARLYSLEYRLGQVEGTVTREVKLRAGETRWKRAEKDVSGIEEAVLKAGQAPTPKPFWMQPGLKRSYP